MQVTQEIDNDECSAPITWLTVYGYIYVTWNPVCYIDCSNCWLFCFIWFYITWEYLEPNLEVYINETKQPELMEP